MKNLIIALAAILISLNSNAQTLTITNGYGSGTYAVGDTVHVWSMAFDSTKIFVNWTGDTAGITNPGEWHTSFVMPAHNLTLAANFRTVSGNTIMLQKIRGKNNLKNVYSCFPAGLKGVIYCLHGTEGSASGWITKVENRQFVNAAIADSFGIIVTEAEEITLNTDLNGDGKLRWFVSPLDSVNNIDYANMKAITDSFILRGKMNRSTPRYSFGMSDGGAFSSSLSYLFNFNAGISYCASGSNSLFNMTTVPTLFCMAKFDNNVNVGPAGNAEALDHYNTLLSRHICTGYYLHDHSPCYPERFARIKGISISASQNIYNQLLSNGFMNSKHFFIYSADTIAARVSANPGGYPAIIGLTPAQRADVIMQIGVMNAEHNFYSDLNRTSLNFFKYPCGRLMAVITANGSTGICEGSYVVLAANTGNAYTYQWLKNNVAIANATLQTYSAASTGNYSVRISGPGNVTATSNLITVSVNALPAPQVNPASAVICPGSAVILSTTAAFTNYSWNTGANTQSITVAAAGNYSVIVSNAAGCQASATANVSSSISCSAPSGLSSSAITKSSAMLNWNNTPCAFSYKLQYRKSGTAAWTNLTVNAPAMSKVITGLSAATSYQWKIRTQCSTGTGNQSNYSAIQVFATTAFREAGKTSVHGDTPDFSVFPNPVSDVCTVQLPENGMTVVLTDLSGRIMLQTRSNAAIMKINCKDFPRGVYLISSRSSSGDVYRSKIIVAR